MPAVTRRTVLGALAAAAAMPAAFSVRAAHTKSLLVYTAVEPEWLGVYREAFRRVRPDIEITYVRASGGPLSARLIAEKDRPRADVVLGLSAISMETLRMRGVLEPYKPQDGDSLNPLMVERDWHWFGMNAWAGSLCVNTDLIAKKGLVMPESWFDLLKPEFSAQIVMPSPKASSTGYMFYLGWLQGFGEKRGWDYAKALHKNMLFYAASGARPAAMAAQGEIAVGMSSAAFVKPFLRYRTPVIPVQPQEGVAWDAEANAMPAGCPHPEEARAFLDFCAGVEVAKIAADFSGIAARRGFSTPEGERISEKFLSIDFARAAQDKARTLGLWAEIAAS